MSDYLTKTQDKVRVLVLTKNLLLGDVLESLFANVITLRVHRVMRPNANGLRQGIDQYQPEVVVLEEGLIGNGYLTLLSQLLNDGRVRVILVNAQENRVHVCDEFSLSLTQAADFIALIENFPTYSL
jgi:hypothetical protein